MYVKELLDAIDVQAEQVNTCLEELERVISSLKNTKESLFAIQLGLHEQLRKMEDTK